jgi:cytochrome c oxidase subunit 1/cytochrome c oxidase subunit I+III
MDFYALGMIFLGISTTVGAANFVVTVMRMRAPGMSINRLPIMIWGTTTVSVGNLLAVPAVSLAFFLLWTDRQFGTHFYGASEGGQPLLWQHLFWIFAHPWVYIIVLPAMGMVSDGLPVFCRRPLVGYTLVALATVVTMVLGFGVWVHHMFATGIPFMPLSLFSGASFVMDKPFGLSSHSYGSLYFTVTGFHMAHVLVGLLILGLLLFWSALGYFDRARMAPVSIGGVYWHFVDAVWLTVFFTFYVTPHLS